MPAIKKQPLSKSVNSIDEAIYDFELFREMRHNSIATSPKKKSVKFSDEIIDIAEYAIGKDYLKICFNLQGMCVFKLNGAQTRPLPWAFAKQRFIESI